MFACSSQLHTTRVCNLSGGSWRQQQCPALLCADNRALVGAWLHRDNPPDTACEASKPCPLQAAERRGVLIAFIILDNPAASLLDMRTVSFVDGKPVFAQVRDGCAC
jgi:hypothetical protein